MLADYIDSIYLLLISGYCTATAFGRLPLPSQDPAVIKQWLTPFGMRLKIIGPLLLSTSVAMAVAKFFGFGG